MTLRYYTTDMPKYSYNLILFENVDILFYEIHSPKHENLKEITTSLQAYHLRLSDKCKLKQTLSKIIA